MPEVFPGVSVDKTHAFGRPRVTGHGVRTETLASRFRAGDSTADLARDYRLAQVLVEAAIRWEMLDRRKKKRLIEKAGGAS